MHRIQLWILLVHFMSILCNICILYSYLFIYIHKESYKHCIHTVYCFTLYLILLSLWLLLLLLWTWHAFREVFPTTYYSTPLCTASTTDSGGLQNNSRNNIMCVHYSCNLLLDFFSLNQNLCAFFFWRLCLVKRE